jgi:hypothetical protein
MKHSKRKSNRKSNKLSGGSSSRNSRLFTKSEMLQGLLTTTNELQKSTNTTPVLDYSVDNIFDKIIKNIKKIDTTRDQKYVKFFKKMKEKGAKKNELNKSKILLQYIKLLTKDTTLPHIVKKPFFKSLKDFSLPIIFIPEPYNSKFFKPSSDYNNTVYVGNSAINPGKKNTPTLFQQIKRGVGSMLRKSYKSKPNP